MKVPSQDLKRKAANHQKVIVIEVDSTEQFEADMEHLLSHSYVPHGSTGYLGTNAFGMYQVMLYTPRI